ncbi:MAG: MFS transporter [Verrucomicrobiae bacterium]|nr:MFS transporter [Verrucomicrobiae bacterium]
MNGSEVTRAIFHHERRRAAAGGMIETASSTFLLLFAVRVFDAQATAKGLVAAGASIGLLLSPLVVWLTARRRTRTSHAAANLALVSAASFLFAAGAPSSWIFVIAAALGISANAAIVPLLTQMYQDGYPETERGRLFTRAMVIRIAAAILFAQAVGELLLRHMGGWRLVTLAFAAAAAFSAYHLRRCPSHALPSSNTRNPFLALRHIRHDRVFRVTLIAWMIMGFGNLMMASMRVEYLANPRYAVNLDAASIAFLTAVVPNFTRLCLSRLWGWLFDRLNFFFLRVVLNVGFAISMVAFFTGDSFTGLVLGASLFGISMAGGDVAWSLWVTKLAPPKLVADYMSVHTFLTGVRGVLAPLLVFHLANAATLETLVIFSGSLILLSILMLLPEIRWGRLLGRGVALIKEISE